MRRFGTQTILLVVCCCFCCMGKYGLAYIADKNQEFNFQAAPQNEPWPLPQQQKFIENELLTLDPATFRLVSQPDDSGSECDIIRHAMERYSKIVLPVRRGTVDPNLPVLMRLNITVEYYKGRRHCGYPSLGDNETYYLQISASPPEATLSSPTVWGMLRGLETFSQLVYKDTTTNAYLVNTTTVVDWPRFPHRGVLLDTARHFISPSVLKKNLDAMSYSKMNVFHWHIVDDQSFPFESKAFPNLTIHGAYSPKHVYLQKTIQDIIEYARLRGIRIIPEFDTPGHTKAIGKAFPNLLTKCHYAIPVKIPTPQKPQPSNGLNPTKERTYKFLVNILAEFKRLFPDKYIHLGMDETNIRCWLSNPSIQRFMAEHKYSAKDLEEYYARRVIGLTKTMGYKHIIWADPLENGVQVTPETVIQLWKGDWMSRARHAANMNYRMVLSSCWYIDMIRYGETWSRYYKCDPLQFSRNTTERQLMLGGEACLWGEYIDNTNLISTLWPSAAAAAERLWNGDEDLYPDEKCRRRFDQHRCRMLRRGIEASPVYSGFCEGDDQEPKETRMVVMKLPFETRPNIFFVWVFVVISVLCSFYWVTLSRPLVRTIFFKLCSSKTVSDVKLIRT